MRGYSMHKDDYRKRLARIEGQVRGLPRMIDEDEYCIDVLTQIASVTRGAAGRRAGPARRAPRATACARRPSATAAEGDAKIAEAVPAVERLLKT